MLISSTGGKRFLFAYFSTSKCIQDGFNSKQLSLFFFFSLCVCGCVRAFRFGYKVVLKSDSC